MKRLIASISVCFLLGLAAASGHQPLTVHHDLKLLAPAPLDRAAERIKAEQSIGDALVLFRYGLLPEFRSQQMKPRLLTAHGVTLPPDPWDGGPACPDSCPWYVCVFWIC
jgi:hypothetical protein